MKSLFRVSISAIALAVSGATSAYAQSALLQGGSAMSGHVPMYLNNYTSQPVVKDGGGAGGGPAGSTLSELGLTVRGAGSPPFVSAGTGPLGTNLCDYDAPTTNATGYHYLCMSPNAAGGGVIDYGAAGGASQLPLQFIINGTTYTLPFLGASVTFNSQAVNSIVAGANITGTMNGTALTLSSTGGGTGTSVTFDGEPVSSLIAGTNITGTLTGTALTLSAAGGTGTSGVTSFNGREGAVALLSADITSALGFVPVSAYSPTFTGTATIPTADITTGLTLPFTGTTQCLQAGPTGIVSGTGATCGTGSGGGGVTSFDTRTGAVTLESSDVDTALGYTPAMAGANSNITSLTGLTTALSIPQGGTGATTALSAITNLTLQSWSVKSFGATGTGNDSATIQAGLNFVSAQGGGTLTLGGSSYFAEGLTIPANVKLQGPGTITALPSSTSSLMTESGAGASVSDVTINGNSANISTGEDCIDITASNTTTAWNTITSCSGGAISLYGGRTDTVIEHNNISGSATTGGGMSFSAEGGTISGLYILDNTVMNDATNQGMLIGTNFTTDVIQNIYVEGNTVTGNGSGTYGGGGIWVDTPYATLIRIIGNYVSGNNGDSISVTAGTTGGGSQVVIANNISTNTLGPPIDPSNSGIVVDGVYGATVTGNRISGNSGPGIVIRHNSAYVTVQGNTISDNSRHSPGVWGGIHVGVGGDASWPSHLMIAGNIIFDDQTTETQTTGILLNSGILNPNSNILGLNNFGPELTDVSGTYGNAPVQATASNTSAGLASGATANILGITLQPGTYMVSATCSFSGQETTVGTQFSCAASPTSGTMPTATTASFASISGSFTGTTSDDQEVIAGAPYPVTVSAAMTYYLVALANFTGGSLTAGGRLTAVRIAP